MVLNTGPHYDAKREPKKCPQNVQPGIAETSTEGVL